MSQAIQRGIVVLAILLVAAVGISVLTLVQKKTLQEQNQNLQEQLADTKSKQDKLLADSKNLQQQVQKLQQDNSGFNQRLSAKEKEKEDVQNAYDDLKRKSDELTTQADQANKERDDWKERLSTIRKERDQLMDKLQHQPEKIVYKERPAPTPAPAASEDSAAAEAPAVPAAPVPQGDEYWANILKQKTQIELDLNKAKADLDKSALQVADLKKQNSELELQVKDLSNDKAEIERRLTNEKKRLQDSFTREKQELDRKLKDSEDLSNNLSLEAARARGDQKQANEYSDKIKEDNAQMQSQIKQLASSKVALEKTVARLNQEKSDMSRRLADTEGVIQDRINEIWQIKKTLDQKITQINQAKSDKEVELPPIIVNGSGTADASSVSNTTTTSMTSVTVNNSGNQTSVAPVVVEGGNYKIISINAKNNFVIVNYGQSQGSTVGRILKAYRGDKEIATLEVIQVRRDISAADIKEQKTNIQVGDQVR
ncbi:MAG: hypothetical protein HQL15_03545 [Candidatus Omnitrophica bacterium]|nr:hypothetical protein [Candidatus Omnitrophota bacterium]